MRSAATIEGRLLDPYQREVFTMSADQFLQDVLASGKIAFSIDDLSGLQKAGLPPTNDLYLYPRPKYPTEPGVLYFTTKGYRRKGSKNDSISEEEYHDLPLHEVEDEDATSALRISSRHFPTSATTPRQAL